MNAVASKHTGSCAPRILLSSTPHRIVTNCYELYPEVFRSMKRMNERAYGVIDGFDGK